MKKINLLNFIKDSLAIIIMWRGFFGVSTYKGMISSSLYMLSFILWFILVILKDKHFLGRLLYQSKSLLLFIFINVLFDYIFSGYLTTRVVNYIVLFIFFSLSFYYIRGNETIKKITISLVIIDFVIIGINTLNILVYNPSAIRLVSTSTGISSITYYGDSSLIANFGTVYSLTILIVFLIYSLLNTKLNYRNRFLFFLISLFSIYFVYKSSFFFAILIIFIMTLYSVLDSTLKLKSNNAVTILKIIVISLSILTFLIARQELGDIFVFMSDNVFFNTVIKGKLNDFGIFIKYGIGEAYMSSLRFDLYKKSFDVFYQNAFFGIHSTWKGLLVSGNHSAWLDGFAYFGILRYFFYLFFLYRMFGFYNRNLNIQFKKSYKVAFSSFVILGLINPNVFPQMWGILCVFLPFISSNNKYEIKSNRTRGTV